MDVHYQLFCVFVCVKECVRMHDPLKHINWKEVGRCIEDNVSAHFTINRLGARNQNVTTAAVCTMKMCPHSVHYQQEKTTKGTLVTTSIIDLIKDYC